jgi:membrane peptidoglycan carboxypeptidase
VGNSNNPKTNGVLGTSGAARIWHNFMVEAHQRLEFARHLADPNGQPYPKEFARPATVVAANVCSGTGKKMGNGTEVAGSRAVAGTPVAVTAGARSGKDFFPVSQPDERCDLLTADEKEELNIALRSIQRDAAKFAPGTTQSVLAYRAAVSNFKPAGGVDPFVGPSPSPAPGQTPAPTQPRAFRPTRTGRR